jgi:hypothetical protein
VLREEEEDLKGRTVVVCKQTIIKAHRPVVFTPKLDRTGYSWKGEFCCVVRSITGTYAFQSTDRQKEHERNHLKLDSFKERIPAC